MKTQHDFTAQVRAFFDLIGYAMPRTRDHYRLAIYWMGNQENIVRQIDEYCEGKERIKAAHLRYFGSISITAKYLVELDQTKTA